MVTASESLQTEISTMETIWMAISRARVCSSAKSKAGSMKASGRLAEWLVKEIVYGAMAQCIEACGETVWRKAMECWRMPMGPKLSQDLAMSIQMAEVWRLSLMDQSIKAHLDKDYSMDKVDIDSL